MPVLHQRLLQLALLVPLQLVLAAAAPVAAPPATIVVECDITVAGGSTASLAAALTAAEAAPRLRVCFTEITDWPGGQLTAGGVPAIDFGELNRFPENQPRSFRSFVRAVRNDSWPERNWEGNRGACSASTTCFQPGDAVSSWITPRLSAATNLRVFMRTVVVSATRDMSRHGRVQSVRAVQRTPRDPAKEWTKPLSQEITDWYSSADSPAFTKQILELRSAVYIEATELADVLLSAKPPLPWAQGVETPTEESKTTDSTCGQASTITFFMELLPSNKKSPAAAPANDSWPAGSPFCFGECAKNFSTDWARGWEYDWTYRRCFVGAGGDHATRVTNEGDITQINYMNDLDTSFLFLPAEESASQGQAGWHGGLNLTTLKMLEDRAWGSYQFLVRSSPNQSWTPRLGINATVAGTRHALSKFVYLRETRRAVGNDGFRLMYSPYFQYFNTSNPRVAYRFNDSVAMGDFGDDVHKLEYSDGQHKCQWPPEYAQKNPFKAFYVPFRALTVGGAPNLLVAGKTMAQTFHANAATRLHPCEWHSGVAAGAAAVLMVQGNLSSTSELDVSALQSLLNSSLVGAPLEFDPAPTGSNFFAPLSRPPGFSFHTLGGMTFAHVTKPTAFNATDLARLAKYQVVTFDKAQDRVDMPNTTTEDIFIQAARQIKKTNPRVTTLSYLNGLIDFPAFRRIHNATLANPSLLLHNSSGKRVDIIPTIPGTFDMRHPAMRKLFVDDALHAINSNAFDGVFIDRANFASRVVLDLEMVPPNTNFVKLGWDVETAQSLVVGQTQLFVELTAALGSKHIVLAKETGGGAAFVDWKVANAAMTTDTFCSSYAPKSVATSQPAAYTGNASCTAQWSPAVQGHVPLKKGTSIWNGTNATTMAKCEEQCCHAGDRCAAVLYNTQIHKCILLHEVRC